MAYSGGELAAGDVVFFGYDNHVALATGRGDEVMSLYNAPAIATPDRPKIEKLLMEEIAQGQGRTLEDLSVAEKDTIRTAAETEFNRVSGRHLCSFRPVSLRKLSSVYKIGIATVASNPW